MSASDETPRRMTPVQYARAIAFAWWASDDGSEEETLLHQALAAVCRRYKLDRSYLIMAVAEDHGEIEIAAPRGEM